MTEIPEEVIRMEATLQRERQERATTAARDAEIVAAIDQDVFVDAHPVSGEISTDDIKDLDIDLNLNGDIMDQNIQLYDIDVAYTRDRHGRHFWSFDDRRRMPLLVIAFRTKSDKQLCLVNDVLVSLEKFLDIIHGQAVVAPRREFGAPPGLPSTDQIHCVTSSGDKITLPHASVAQLMMALQTVPAELPAK